MASVIKIKKSGLTPVPNVLASGELAYSWASDKLYIGYGTESIPGEANNIAAVGGEYYTNYLNHTPGTLTASAAILTDANSKIDLLLVDNLQLDGNAITSTNTNGNISITPNGTGSIVLDGQNWPQADGSNKQILTTNGAGQLSWLTGSIGLTADTGTISINLSDTLIAQGSNSISTEVLNNVITISAANASTTTKGVASFDSAHFSVNSGAVSVKDSGITNVKLANSSITLGSTSISLGGTSDHITGLLEISVGNVEVSGNTISSTDTNGNIILSPDGTGNIDVSNKRIIGVGTPVNDTDAANKLYVDNAINGLTYKQAVNLLAASNVSLSGITNTLVIDSHAALTSANNGYRILLTAQTDATQNGIYEYTDNGSTYTLIRSIDADTYQELISTTVLVLEGTSYGATSWIQSNHYITSFAGQLWVQLSSSAYYSAGSGLNLDGTIFNVGAGDGIVVNADTVALANTIAGNGLTYADGVVNIVGTLNRISVSSDSIDIADTYAGQTSITTLGIVTAGTWNASTITVPYGGTGLTSIAARGILYASASNTLAVLAGATSAGSILTQDADGNPYWAASIEGGTF